MSTKPVTDELVDEEIYNPEEDDFEYTEWTYNEAKHRYEYVPEFAEDNQDG